MQPGMQLSLPQTSQRERERERVRKRERDIKREREREEERVREREMYNMVTLFLFLKGMTGALTPFSYLICK